MRTATYVLLAGVVSLISCGGGDSEPNASLPQSNRAPSIVKNADRNPSALVQVIEQRIPQRVYSFQ